MRPTAPSAPQKSKGGASADSGATLPSFEANKHLVPWTLKTVKGCVLPAIPYHLPGVSDPPERRIDRDRPLIRAAPSKGRCAVASRNISAGETVLLEKAFWCAKLLSLYTSSAARDAIPGHLCLSQPCWQSELLRASTPL